jgi:hypothetical protein
MKIKRYSSDNSFLPSFLNVEGSNAETVRRMFLLDVSTSQEKDIIASLVYSESEQSNVALFYKDYDIKQIIIGGCIEVALKQQKQFQPCVEVPIRIEKAYRFLKRSFDFTRIQNEVMNTKSDFFLGMNVYTHQIKVYSNVPPCVLLEIAEVSQSL